MSNKYVERTDLARVNQTRSGEVEFHRAPALPARPKYSRLTRPACTRPHAYIHIC